MSQKYLRKRRCTPQDTPEVRHCIGDDVFWHTMQLYGEIMLAHELGLPSPDAVGFFGDDPESTFVALSSLAFAVYSQLPGDP